MEKIDEKLLLVSDQGEQIVGRVTGNENAKYLLFLLHGFGVKSDSRGMYNTIVESLDDDYLTIRFHFGKIDSITNTILIPEYSKQVSIFKTVFDSFTKKYPNKIVKIISHSQGCYIASMLLTSQNYDAEKVILLAPLVRDSAFTSQQKKYNNRPGSTIDREGTSQLVRTDGSTTIVKKPFWDEAESINSRDLFQQMDSRYKTFFVWPKGDSENKPMEYKNLKDLNLKNFYEIEGDHDFISTGNWDTLITFLKDKL